jgi:hypothetical protein
VNRHLCRAVLALAIVVPALGVSPTIAVAAQPGYVRLAHLSPDTPQVDVWLTSFRGGSYSKVLPGVAYGTVSPYERLAPGAYAVTMRSPGSAADSAPLIRTTLTVQRGAAYTVAGVGRNSDLKLRVLKDDLSRPSNGAARVRVVQASAGAPVVDVATASGMVIAEGARFPSQTKYAEVPAQRWTLEVRSTDGSETTTRSVDVRAGAVYTAFVLDSAPSGIALLVRTDAAGARATPRGSVDTGLGGGAPDGPSHGTWRWALVLAAVAFAAGAAARRPRPLVSGRR